MKGLEFVFLGLGGILGTFLRYKLLESHLLFNFIPLNTLIVNILGSFILGIFIVSSIHFNIDGKYALFIAVGFCGSLTTFSAFALDNSALLENNQNRDGSVTIPDVLHSYVKMTKINNY